MTTPSKPPLTDQDCYKLEKLKHHVSEGNNPKLAAAGPEMTGRSGTTRRLSTIAEQEADKPGTERNSHDALGVSERTDSSLSVCSDKFKNSSSHYSSDDSYLPGSGEDCAALLLSCLYCRFHELMALLPDTCERAVRRCFPSYKYIVASAEMDERGLDCCSLQLELDCSAFGSCQDVGQLVELAMEISEVCYR